MRRLSLITQFKIDFLLPFTDYRKEFKKIPAYITWDVNTV